MCKSINKHHYISTRGHAHHVYVSIACVVVVEWAFCVVQVVVLQRQQYAQTAMPKVWADQGSL